MHLTKNMIAMTNRLNLKAKSSKQGFVFSSSSNLEELNTNYDGFKNWEKFEDQTQDPDPLTIEVFSIRDDGLVQRDTFGD